MTLHEQVADQLRKYVDKGVYGPGSKLPSVRRLSSTLNVSISTVMQAYSQLEKQGVVEAIPKSGYYVKHVTNVLPAVPAISKPLSRPTKVSINELVMEILHSGYGRGVIQFGTALPCIDFPEVHQMDRLFSSIARNKLRRVSRYEFPPGNQELRLQIARRLIDAGMSVSPDDIVVTAGCQEALMLAIHAVAKSGDTIAVESPGYCGVLQQIELLEMRALEIPTDFHTGISLDALSLALDQWPIKALVLTPQFSNPLGCQMPDENKVALLELLKQHDIPLIEDDINGELGYTDKRARAIQSWDNEGRVLYCSSISKALESGVRIGWIAPGRYFNTVEQMKIVTNRSTATLPQMVVAEFLETGGYDRHLRTARATYRERRDELLRIVSQHFPDTTRVTRPDGGFLAWLELPKPFDSLQLYYKAMEIGISTAPGPLFSASGKYRNFMRINYSMPWTREYTDGLIQLAGLINQQLAEPRSAAKNA